MNHSSDMGDTQAPYPLVDEAPHSSNDSRFSVIVVGTETAVFNEVSETAQRIYAYARHFSEMHVIVLCSDGYKEKRVGNVYIYPASSSSRVWRMVRAYSVAKRVPRADVVTVQDPFECGLLGLAIAAVRRIPLHVQAHTDLFDARFASHSLLNFLRRHVAVFILRRAKGIRVVSERVKHSIASRVGAIPIRVLPIFIDLERFKSAQPGEELMQRFASFAKKLLVVSRFEPEKNVDRAIVAFTKAAPKDACLIILGTGRERERLQRIAKERGVASRVFFEGRHDPAPYFKLADLVLVPSSYEGYGLVIIEALAAGTPVLATDVGVAREAGAIVTDEAGYSDALAAWFKNGPEKGELASYPYQSFDAYVRAYCEDIIAAKREAVAQ